ncbi:MAG: gliding motility-associated C-terminal domain-containing protein [Bacteroidota bacterium]
MAVVFTLINTYKNKANTKPRCTTFLPALLVFSMVLLFSNRMFSQSTNWFASAEPQKVFIENKGQFHIHPSAEPVLFAVDGGSTCIYFTKTGISYSFLKRWAKQNKKEESDYTFSSIEQWKEKEAEEKRMEFESDAVWMQWTAANPDVEIVGYDATPDYHSYCVKGKDGEVTNINHSKAYRKIVYKNIYPNIDIAFVFHPSDGLKYSVILHPGADVSNIKMNYSGTTDIKTNGDVHIATKFGDMIDHAPATFYSDRKTKTIGSHFVKTGNTIGFELGAYNQSKDITIDPWTQTPALLNSNGVWECERDGAGNVYIIGGDMPMKLIKYDALGAIQWTYNTPFDTANNWLGTFATDLAGNSYVTSGSIAALQKINTSGGLVYNATSGIGSSNEYWNIAFNCDQTKLIIGGTSGSLFSLQGAIFDINTSNGSINSTKLVGYGNMFGFPPTIEEVRSISSCRNSRYYFMTLDTIGAIDDDFSVCPSSGPAVFRVNHGYHLSYKCENYRPNNGNSGIMSIRANKNFVYTQNGTTVEKRSLIDGSIISSAALPGGINVTTLGQHQVGNSGIDIDSCGNVYVGSGNGVYKFDANLNLITSIATAYKVSDVNISTNGDVIFCGTTGTNSSTNRVGTIQSANMSACPPMTLVCCDASVCPAGPFCIGDAPFALTFGTPGGTWSGAGVNASTGVFDPSTAGVGTHTITYTVACGSNSINIVVNSCATLNVCQEANGNLTVAGGASPYTWQASQDTVDCSSCIIGCIFPVGCAVTSTIWTTFATGNTVTPPANDTIRVIDNNGVVLVIYDTVSLAACGPCPSLSVITSNIVSVCTGQSNGSFTANTSGGTSPYDYTLMNGSSTIATFNDVSGPQNFTGLAAGTYTVNVVDSNNCPGTIVVTISSLTNLTPLISGPTTICAGNQTLLDVGAGYTTYLWSTGAGTQTISISTAGNYTVTVTNGSGCSGSASVNVSAITLTLSLNPHDEGCLNSCTGYINSTVGGGSAPYTYLWSNGQTTANILGICSGNYSVTVTDSNSCTKILTAVVGSEIIGAGFTANPTSGTVPLSVSYNYTGTGAFTWAWDFGDGTTSTLENPVHSYDSVGSYLVTLIVSSGAPFFCYDTSQMTIEVHKPSVLVIPNIFTPNNDGHNDEFIMQYKEIESFSCAIYNRWGKKIFEWTDISKGWDGKTNGGTTAADGVYYYILSAKGNDGVVYDLNGTVTLLR